MEDTDTSTDTLTSVNRPPLPNGWSWRHAEGGTVYYSRWFGTKYDMGGPHAGDYGLGGFEGEIYWDKRGDDLHHVRLTPILSINEIGDPSYGYDCLSRRYDTAEEAHQAVPDLINSL